MSETREHVFHFLKQTGPVLPVQVAKFLKTDIIIASAILSELTATKRALISHAAIGGSRVYYLPEQKHMLEAKLFEHLHNKEKEAYKLLKERQVLNEQELEPWQRIAYRDLKDFAIPIEVNTQESTHRFWMFHLTHESIAKEKIRKYFEQQIPYNENKQLTQVQEAPKEEKQEVEIKEPRNEMSKEEPVMQEVNTTSENKQKIETTEEIKKEIPQEKKEISEEQKVFVEKPTGNFYKKIIKYCEDKGMHIVKEEIIRKNKEFNFIVHIPTPIGKIPFFMKVKEKTSIADTDISLAYSEGHQQQLATIFMIEGKMNKKAIELENKLKNKITIIKL